MSSLEILAKRPAAGRWVRSPAYLRPSVCRCSALCCSCESVRFFLTRKRARLLSVTGANVLFYIRFICTGFVVGNAGLVETLFQFAIAYTIIVFTVMSVCAISTNGAVEGGGAYCILLVFHLPPPPPTIFSINYLITFSIVFYNRRTPAFSSSVYNELFPYDCQQS